MQFKKTVLVALALVVASPAHADWQYTRWGMTPEETVASSKGALVLSHGEAGEQLPGSQLNATGSYQTGEFHFKARFYFVNNKLSEIRLILNDPELSTIALRHALLGKYGQPFSKNSDFITTFHDKDGGNRIDMIAIGSARTTLIYRPLVSEGASGL